MNRQPVELRGIVAAAATLEERLSSQYIQDNQPAQAQVVNTRLERWRRNVSQGDRERFRMRLAAQGLDEQQLDSILDSVLLNDEIPLPLWAQTLADVMQCPDNDPGSDLLEPFVIVGRRRLADRAGELRLLLSENASTSLEAHLRHQLSEAASPTLGAYRNKPALRNMLVKYPVLARLLATLTDFWVENSAQLLERFNADRTALAETFGPLRDFSVITAITAGLSEAHRNGQVVLQLTFSNEVTLFYKPRNLGLEIAWFDLLHRINQTGMPLSLTCLRLLGREAYGWMELADASPCANREQISRYYRRAGSLLRLLYLFGGSDFQRENVIACADQPVLIDLETLLTPTVRGQEFRLKPQRINASVLQTHFLPALERAAGGGFRAIGGMEAIYIPEEFFISWEERAVAVKDGFQEMSHWLDAHSSVVSSAFEQFEGLRLRVIFQDTRAYQRLLQRSLQPHLLKNSLDRRIELEQLHGLACPSAAYEQHFPRIQQEIAMLEQLDIPCFETRTDTTDLPVLPDETLRDYFVEPACQVLRRNLRQFDVPEQDRQLRLVQNVFDFQAARTGSQVAQADLGVPSEHNMAGDGNLAEAAEVLAGQVKSMAQPTVSGGVVWMIPEETLTAQDQAYQFQQSDGFLYQGSAGIALFLAAMETIRPGVGYGDLARTAISPLTAWLNQPWLPRKIGIGAAHGLGSLVYALVKTSQFLAQPVFVEQAGQVAALITPERIAADERLDVFAGAAGAILGLLALYDATHERQVLKQAMRCGEYLLTRRTTTFPRAWQTIRPTPVSGFSHGIAGIAYALLRLFQATGQEPLRQAALDGIACERQLFSAAAGNWRAFDSAPEQPVFWNTYCHGAPGIALARMGGLGMLDTPEIRDEISAALQTTIEMPLDGLDFLCCGNFGRLGVLLIVGQRLQQPELVSLARLQAARLLARQTQSGGFRLFESLPPRVVNPGLFRGIAGIGYQLLRLSDPQCWPDLLLWE